MKTQQLIYLLPVIVALAHGKSVNVQSVIYSDGAVPGVEEDMLSSAQMEDIPPREQWFRVRGDRQRDRAPQQQYQPGFSPQRVAHGEREVVELPPDGNRTPKRIASNAVPSQRERSRESHVPPENIVRDRADPNPNNGRHHNQNVQVEVRNRGKVGLQSRGMKKESDDNRSSDVFTRRIGDREDDWANGPSQPAGRRQNGGAHHAGHQSGQHKAKSTKEGDRDVIIIEEHTSQQQQPREPDEGDYVEVVEDHVDRKEEEIVVVARHQDDLGERDNGDVVYEYEDVNDSRSRNRNTQPAQQVQDGQRTLIKTSRDRSHSRNSPPPHEQVAKMARYIVHNSNWTSIATTSTMRKLQGYPFANVISVSDGPIDDSRGTPYMYMTPLDMSAIDLKRDSRASLTMSLAQSDYCRKQEYDPEDPRCAHVTLSGKIIQVTPPDEKAFAMNAVFSRHPEMRSWPKDHGWYFAKLDIEHIVVLDYFGGGKTVKVDDYFNQ